MGRWLLRIHGVAHCIAIERRPIHNIDFFHYGQKVAQSEERSAQVRAGGWRDVNESERNVRLPDERTILRFRHLLGKHDLAAQV